jgi:hypothetical protein
MRTTITIHDPLLEAAKQKALEKKCTLSSIVEDALRASLYQQDTAEQHQAAEPWPTHGGRGTLPGIDLDDNASLLDQMEKE